MCFFYCHGDHRYLHVWKHSCPTRRSSDLSTRPRRTSTATAARAPLPQARVSPTPRSNTRKRMRSRATTCAKPTLADSANAGDCCRSEEHTSELQSLMRISYAVFCLKKKKKTKEKRS